MSPLIIPYILIFPLISSFCDGLSVPIPIFPLLYSIVNFVNTLSSLESVLILKLSLSLPSIPIINLGILKDFNFIIESLDVFVLLIVNPTTFSLPVISILSVTPKDVNWPTDVIFVCAAVDNVPVKVPPLIAPVVVIVELPILIFPKLLVIEPPSNVPTDVIWVCVASIDNECVVPSPLVAAVDVIPVPPVIVAT